MWTEVKAQHPGRRRSREHRIGRQSPLPCREQTPVVLGRATPLVELGADTEPRPPLQHALCNPGSEGFLEGERPPGQLNGDAWMPGHGQRMWPNTTRRNPPCKEPIPHLWRQRDVCLLGLAPL